MCRHSGTRCTDGGFLTNPRLVPEHDAPSLCHGPAARVDPSDSLRSALPPSTGGADGQASPVFPFPEGRRSGPSRGVGGMARAEVGAGPACRPPAAACRRLPAAGPAARPSCRLPPSAALWPCARPPALRRTQHRASHRSADGPDCRIRAFRRGIPAVIGPTHRAEHPGSPEQPRVGGFLGLHRRKHAAGSDPRHDPGRLVRLTQGRSLGAPIRRAPGTGAVRKTDPREGSTRPKTDSPR